MGNMPPTRAAVRSPHEARCALAHWCGGADSAVSLTRSVPQLARVPLPAQLLSLRMARKAPLHQRPLLAQAPLRVHHMKMRI
jgi:hypothetical protein